MRYLDDCFIYWDTSIGPITELHNILNNSHQNIKFTVDTNYKRMNFLDIKIMKQADKIIIDIHHKPTDTQNYVPFRSALPNHTLKNILYNLARRLCTIVDEKITLSTRLSELEENLKHLGYPKTRLRTDVKKKKIPQEQLQPIKEKDQEREVRTYVSTKNYKIC